MGHIGQNDNGSVGGDDGGLRFCGLSVSYKLAKTLHFRFCLHRSMSQRTVAPEVFDTFSVTFYESSFIFYTVHVNSSNTNFQK